jgi:hypothetical protein
MFSVYILVNEKTGRRYTGFCEGQPDGLAGHNAGRFGPSPPMSIPRNRS